MVKLPSFYTDDTPASANETWARLHADPLFQARPLLCPHCCLCQHWHTYHGTHTQRPGLWPVQPLKRLICLELLTSWSVYWRLQMNPLETELVLCWMASQVTTWLLVLFLLWSSLVGSNS